MFQKVILENRDAFLRHDNAKSSCHSLDLALLMQRLLSSLKK